MKACVLALGFFDGVHLGHGELLKRTRQTADALGITAAAMTFDRSPAALITGQSIPLLNTPSERVELMKTLYGMDEVYVLPFDEHTRQQPWEDFAQKVLLETYHAVHIVCGDDYRFGSGGRGNAQRLSEFCRQKGLGFDCIGEICLEGQRVSSTHIRKLLSRGSMEEAVRFLGHPHILTGPVVDGRKVGRTIGIPTANVQPAPEVGLPKNGVYAALARFEGKAFPAVVNIGTRPTFHGSTVTVEPWLLDFDGDLYGKTLRLEFYAYLREERRFSSPWDLKEEIQKNAESTRAILKSKMQDAASR